MALTHAQLAKKLDVSESTISTWKRKGCPVRSTLDAIRKWVANYEATNPRKQQVSADPQLAQLRKAILAEELAERRERRLLAALKRQEKELTLVSIEAARTLIGKIVGRSRTAALNLAKTRARQFVALKSHADAQRQLDAFVKEVIKSLEVKQEDV